MAIPDKIKQLANKVRNEIFGKDVREAFAKSMEETSDVADKTEKRQDDVESQFQNLLDETTGKDVISAPEILASRVDAKGMNHSNLKQRLDAEQNEVTSALAQTEYELQEGIQNLDSSINEKLNDVVKHRPIHVGLNEPSNQIGDNGDLYLQMYEDNEIRFYEEGLFTPYIRGTTYPDIIEYSTQYGRYVRVGNLVTIFIDIQVGALTLGGATGTMRIYGIPYSSLIDQNVPLSGSLTGFDLGDDNRVIASAVMGVNHGYFRMHSYLLNDADMDRHVMNISNINNNFSLRTSFSYLATENATMQLEKLV